MIDFIPSVVPGSPAGSHHAIAGASFEQALTDAVTEQSGDTSPEGDGGAQAVLGVLLGAPKGADPRIAALWARLGGNAQTPDETTEQASESTGEVSGPGAPPEHGTAALRERRASEDVPFPAATPLPGTVAAAEPVIDHTLPVPTGQPQPLPNASDTPAPSPAAAGPAPVLAAVSPIETAVESATVAVDQALLPTDSAVADAAEDGGPAVTMAGAEPPAPTDVASGIAPRSGRVVADGEQTRTVAAADTRASHKTERGEPLPDGATTPDGPAPMSPPGDAPRWGERGPASPAPEVTDVTRRPDPQPEPAGPRSPSNLDAAPDAPHQHQTEVSATDATPARDQALRGRAERLAGRIEQWVARTEHQPPPHVLTLRTGDSRDGLTIRVALEAGALRISVDGAGSDDLTWLRTAADQLRARGFDVSEFGGGHRHRDQPDAWNQDDGAGRAGSRTRPARRTAPSGLRL